MAQSFEGLRGWQLGAARVQSFECCGLSACGPGRRVRICPPLATEGLLEKWRALKTAGVRDNRTCCTSFHRTFPPLLIKSLWVLLWQSCILQIGSSSRRHGESLWVLLVAFCFALSHLFSSRRHGESLWVESNLRRGMRLKASWKPRFLLRKMYVYALPSWRRSLNCAASCTRAAFCRTAPPPATPPPLGAS